MDYDKLQADFIELVEENKKLIYKVSHLYCDNTIDKKDCFKILFQIYGFRILVFRIGQKLVHGFIGYH